MTSFFADIGCMQLYDQHFRCMEVNPGLLFILLLIPGNCNPNFCANECTIIPSMSPECRTSAQSTYSDAHVTNLLQLLLAAAIFTLQKK